MTPDETLQKTQFPERHFRRDLDPEVPHDV
jgi:hypothetical protein